MDCYSLDCFALWEVFANDKKLVAIFASNQDAVTYAKYYNVSSWHIQKIAYVTSLGPR